MNARILKLDVGGQPLRWISWETAATLYARDSVAWEAGETRFTIRGGINASSGLQSSMDLSSIIAVREASGSRRRRPPPLTNRALFARDGYICLYCGEKFPVHQLTRDHVRPRSLGGKDVWTNVATCCRVHNAEKSNLPPDRYHRKLLAVPFTPDPAAYLLLMASGRRITADQQEWLEACAKKNAAPN